jgi:hypothetical protein
VSLNSALCALAGAAACGAGGAWREQECAQRTLRSRHRAQASRGDATGSGLRLVALMIDGVHFSDHVVLAAVGIDSAGEKHPLGLREGARKTPLPAPRCSPTRSSVGSIRTRPCWW